MHPITRRTALQLSAGLLLTPTVADAESPPKTVIVDTHLHCFAGKDDKRFPYHPAGPYQPPEAATPEHLLKVMAEGGVDHAIVVHPEPYQDDHRYLEHCLTVGKGKLKGTALFFAGRPGLEEAVKKLAAAVPLVALRAHAYNPDRLPPFGKPEFSQLWKLADSLGLAMQLHFEPRYAEGFEPYIKDFPKVRVLIDHLGRPFQGTPKEHQRVIDWSKHKNVAMKLSSVPNKGAYPHRDPQEVVRALVQAYGAERLMYGGGYDAKTTGESYRKERVRVGEFLQDLTAADRALIFGGTAAKVFGFLKT